MTEWKRYKIKRSGRGEEKREDGRVATPRGDLCPARLAMCARASGELSECVPTRWMETKDIRIWGRSRERYQSQAQRIEGGNPLFSILAHREMRELILGGLHLFFPLSICLYSTILASWHSLRSLPNVTLPPPLHSSVSSSPCFSALIPIIHFFFFCIFFFPPLRPFLFLCPQFSIFLPGVPPRMVYGFMMHGNLAGKHVYLLFLCLPFCCLSPLLFFLTVLLGCLHSTWAYTERAKHVGRRAGGGRKGRLRDKSENRRLKTRHRMEWWVGFQATAPRERGTSTE